MKKKKNDCSREAPANFAIGYSDYYIKLSKYRSIFINEGISVENAGDLSALLLYYDALNSDEITLYIHTNGGSVAGLINIYDVMQIINSPIKTICIGKAYSAGAVLLAAGSKGNRFAFKHASVMIHGIQAGFPGAGDVINAKNYYEYLHDINKNIVKILSQHTGKSVEEVEEDCKKDLFMTAEQALEYGIIDGIIG